MQKNRAFLIAAAAFILLAFWNACTAETLSVQGLWEKTETNQGTRTETKWHGDFQSAHAGVQILATHRTVYKSTKALCKALGGRFHYDVFVVESAAHDLEQVMSTQMCADLSKNEAVKEQTERMHGVFAAGMGRGNALYGVPIWVTPRRMLCYNKEAWALAGLGQQDIPDSFDSFLRFLEKWVEQMKAAPIADICVMIGCKDAGEAAYTRWLLELLVNGQYHQCLYTGKAVCFDTPDFVHALERIQKVGADLYRYGNAGEHSLFWDVSGDVSTLGQWIPLRLTSDEDAILPVDVTFLCVYEQSKNKLLAMDAVQAYLDSICRYEPDGEIVSEDDQRLNIAKALLFSDFEGPVQLPQYQYMVTVRTDILARKEAALADDSLSEAERKKAEEQAEFARQTLAEQLADPYILTEEEMLAYRQRIPNFAVTKPMPFDLGSSAVRKRSDPFLNEQITAQEFAQKIEALAIAE